MFARYEWLILVIKSLQYGFTARNVILIESVEYKEQGPLLYVNSPQARTRKRVRCDNYLRKLPMVS